MVKILVAELPDKSLRFLVCGDVAATVAATLTRAAVSLASRPFDVGVKEDEVTPTIVAVGEYRAVFYAEPRSSGSLRNALLALRRDGFDAEEG